MARVHTSRTHASRVLARIVTACLVIAMIIATGPASISSAQTTRPSKLDKESRGRLAGALANGESTVMVMFATAEGTSPSVVAALVALGASIRYHDADLGYIRAAVPTAEVDAATKISNVLAAEIDFVVDVPPVVPDADATDAAPPTPLTPQQNAYMPTKDIGAPQFVAANPTFDGRGITIGIVDTGVDLHHPALQTTSTGERKITDWVTGTHPVDDNDPTWVTMSTTVTVTAGTFTVGSGATAVTYTNAPDGTFQYGVFSEASIGGTGSEYNVACGADLDRDGVCNERFAVLWTRGDATWAHDTVWVDSNGDRSFADATPMRAYNKDFDIGYFGTDNPATAVREAVPFVVEVAAAYDKVSLGIVSGAHGSHVAGIAAGNNIFGGDADGAAPGAKIKSLRACMFVSGCTAHALFEGMIRIVKEMKVDVVNMSIGGLPSLNDGNNPRAILYNTLIDKYGVQLFISAGNSGPGGNTVGDPSVATKVMSIGAHWTKESVEANYGTIVPAAEALHDFSSRGPREDGGLKPQVVAPGNAVSPIPTWQNGSCLTTPNCGPGYGMFNGTSMASPQAAGAGALLLSAAVQSDVGHNPAQLRKALNSSARFIPGYGAYEQGHGLIRVGEAWDLLKGNLKTEEISSSITTNSLLSPFLATPNTGTGFYDRENVFTGQSITRMYTFRRADGGQGTYDVRWIGDTAAFSSPSQISVTKQGSATLAVTFNAQATPGAYSALLVLDDPKTAGIEYSTLNTVFVGTKLDASNGYSATVSGTAKRFEASQPKHFFQVPTGATALRNTVTITNNSRIRWFRMHPYGVSIDPSNTAFFGEGVPGVSQTRTTQTTPLPGQWEIAVAASRSQTFTTAPPPPATPVTRPLADTATFTARATAYKVTLDPTSWTQDPTTVGTTYTKAFTAKNEFAAGNMIATGSSLASTREVHASIASGGALQEYAITVPAGATNLTVTIGNASDLQADLDLYLYNCTSGTCVLVRQGTGSTANESVSFPNPTAGAWRAVVDPFSVPAGSTTYTYSDAFANPAYGSVTTDDVLANRGSGTSWNFTASAKANVAAESGRFFRGSVNVRLDSATGAILSTAIVELRGVTAAP